MYISGVSQKYNGWQHISRRLALSALDKLVRMSQYFKILWWWLRLGFLKSFDFLNPIILSVYAIFLRLLCNDKVYLS